MSQNYNIPEQPSYQPNSGMSYPQYDSQSYYQNQENSQQLTPQYNDTPYQDQSGYYGSQQEVYPGYSSTPTTQTNIMALSSLIISCVSVLFGGLLAIVSAILGHIGLNQIKKNNEEGKTLAIIGLVLSYAQIALWLIAIAAFVLFVILGVAQTG